MENHGRDSRCIERLYDWKVYHWSQCCREKHGAGSLRPPETRNLVVSFQSEYLFAAIVDTSPTSGAEDVICTIPDLISILGGRQRSDRLSAIETQSASSCCSASCTSTVGRFSRRSEGRGPNFFGLDMSWRVLVLIRNSRALLMNPACPPERQITSHHALLPFLDFAVVNAMLLRLLKLVRPSTVFVAAWNKVMPITVNAMTTTNATQYVLAL